jgi:hypothetical protein
MWRTGNSDISPGVTGPARHWLPNLSNGHVGFSW